VRIRNKIWLWEKKIESYRYVIGFIRKHWWQFSRDRDKLLYIALERIRKDMFLRTHNSLCSGNIK
jgi:hypothetical protein